MYDFLYNLLCFILRIILILNIYPIFLSRVYFSDFLSSFTPIAHVSQTKQTTRWTAGKWCRPLHAWSERHHQLTRSPKESGLCSEAFRSTFVSGLNPTLYLKCKSKKTDANCVCVSHKKHLFEQMLRGTNSWTEENLEHRNDKCIQFQLMNRLILPVPV